MGWSRYARAIPEDFPASGFNDDLSEDNDEDEAVTLFYFPKF